MGLGLAAGVARCVNSFAIRGAAISINQHTREDTTINTNITITIVKVDTNSTIITKGTLCPLSFFGVTSCKQRAKPSFLCSLGKVL